MPGPSVTPPTTPSTVSLSTLVGLAAGEAERSTTPKAKAKGKAKTTRKKVVKEEPQTPKEKKDAARKWSILSIVFCEKRFMANVYIKCFHAETQHLFTIQKTIIKKRTIHLRQWFEEGAEQVHGYFWSSGGAHFARSIGDCKIGNGIVGGKVARFQFRFSVCLHIFAHVSCSSHRKKITFVFTKHYHMLLCTILPNSGLVLATIPKLKISMRKLWWRHTYMNWWGGHFSKRLGLKSLGK